VATNVARADDAVERAEVMRPLFSPWFELEDARRTETPRKSGFWGSLGQFLFDYNRY
jgi:hypothetical protein